MAVIGDLLLLLDILVLVLVGWSSSLIYAHWFTATGVDVSPWSEYQTRVLVAALLAPLLLRDSKFITCALAGGQRLVLRRFAARFLRFAGIVLAIGFASRALDTLPRPPVVMWFVAGGVCTAAIRALLVTQLTRLERKGLLTERVAVVGAGPVADRLIEYLRHTRPRGIEVVGIFDDRVNRAEQGVGKPTGTIADLVELGKARSIDWILLTLPSTADDRLDTMVHSLKSLAVAVGLCPQNVGSRTPCHLIDYVGDGLPVTLLADRPLKRWDVLIKSAEDVILGGLITLMLSPLLMIIALAVRLDSPGPVIFRQRRHTWNNREFDVYKFRTMKWAPQKSGEPLRQTARDDDRVTCIGRFLRKTSLDELPQLFNVLKGEMSLVGPRPHAVNMRTEDRLGHEIIDTYAHRHRVKPGMTGWSQVNGFRGATETVEQLRRRVELDLYYVDHWSLWFDLKILLMTFWVVVRGTNAH